MIVCLLFGGTICVEYLGDIFRFWSGLCMDCTNDRITRQSAITVRRLLTRFNGRRPPQ